MPQKPIPLGEDFIPLGQDFEPEAVPVQSENPLISLWHQANAPMTTLPSQGAHAITGLPNQSRGIADSLGVGGLYDIWDQIQRGGLNVAGDIASGLTSPLNVGMAVASGGTSLAGKAGYGGIASGLNIVNKLLSAPVAAEGAIDTFSPDSTL